MKYLRPEAFRIVFRALEEYGEKELTSLLLQRAHFIGEKLKKS